MKTLRVNALDVSKGHLILVNPSHPLRQDVKRDMLVPVQPTTANILLEKQAAKMLAEVMTTLNCDGQIVPVSGYRSMGEQQEIYRDSLREFRGAASTKRAWQ